MRKLDPIAAKTAMSRSREAAKSPYDLDETWVARNKLRVVAQSTARKVDDDQTEALLRACSVADVSSLLAVPYDDDVVPPLTTSFEVNMVAHDLKCLNDEFFGLNVVLVSLDLPIALLATVDDYSVLAGPSSFVSAYQPDSCQALEDFREFALTQPDFLRPAAERALSLFERFPA